MTRYQKQILLPELGTAGQARLAQARVLVVGAGGLGCPALLYLTAAGVGCIGIVDFDAVEASNLQRQILFQAADVGRAKVEVAAERLSALNPELQVETFREAVSPGNALDLIAGFDLVLDGSDNFPTRYIVNDACALLGKPLVYGSVYRFEGQVGVFNVEENGIRTTYRDLFPEPPDPAEVADCNQAGVIGTVPGIIGTMQANEVIKIITGAGKPLYNRLLTYHALHNSLHEIGILPHPEALLHAPKNAAEFLETDYDWFCHSASDVFTQLSAVDFDAFRRAESPLVLDVRNPEETPRVTEFEHLCIPLSELVRNLHHIDKNRALVIFCQTGVRSITAANLIAGRLGHPRVYNLKGGIVQWKTHP